MAGKIIYLGIKLLFCLSGKKDKVNKDAFVPLSFPPFAFVKALQLS